MKKIMIATAVACALSGPFAYAQSGYPRYEHGWKTNEQHGAPAGWAYRMPGNNAELEGNNANSGGGSNSSTDGQFSSSG
jgi:hypothetical protein